MALTTRGLAWVLPWQLDEHGNLTAPVTTDLHPDRKEHTVTDLREPHSSPTADICRAVDILRDARTPAAIAAAELLEAIADDMHDAGAYQRQAFAGTPAEHPVVWDRERARHDWTAVLELAHTVLRRTR